VKEGRTSRNVKKELGKLPLEIGDQKKNPNASPGESESVAICGERDFCSGRHLNCPTLNRREEKEKCLKDGEDFSFLRNEAARERPKNHKSPDREK